MLLLTAATDCCYCIGSCCCHSTQQSAADHTFLKFSRKYINIRISSIIYFNYRSEIYHIPHPSVAGHRLKILFSSTPEESLPLRFSAPLLRLDEKPLLGLPWRSCSSSPCSSPRSLRTAPTAAMDTAPAALTTNAPATTESVKQLALPPHTVSPNVGDTTPAWTEPDCSARTCPT